MTNYQDEYRSKPVSPAHPDFRGELVEPAGEMKIWSHTNRICF